MPTQLANYGLRLRSLVDNNPYLALVYGDVSDGEDTLVTCTRGT